MLPDEQLITLDEHLAKNVPIVPTAQLSSFLKDKLSQATLKEPIRTTSYNEIIYFGLEDDLPDGVENPFDLTIFSDKVITRLAYSLQAFAEQPDRSSHAYKRHGNDAVLACWMLSGALQRGNLNDLAAIIVKDSRSSVYDASSRLAIFGEDISETLWYPYSYLEALKAKTTTTLPKENFLQKLDLRDLLLTCAYLDFHKEVIFSGKGKKRGLRSFSNIEGLNFSIDYDLPGLIARRVRDEGLNYKNIADIYEQITYIFSGEKFRNIKIIGETTSGNKQVDVLYDEEAFVAANQLMIKAGINNESDPFTIAEVIRRPVVILSSPYYLLKNSPYIGKDINLNRLRRELDRMFLFTNHLATAYMDTELIYLQHTPGGAVTDEIAINMLESGKGRVACIKFGRDVIP